MTNGCGRVLSAASGERQGNGNGNKCKNRKQFAVYVHIPFCIKKCDYCDFLSAPASADVQERYVQALIREIRAEGAAEQADRTEQVISVFFGGGTPSILQAGRIGDILQALRECFVFAPEAEITVECNPGTLDAARLSSYRQAGVNRLSIGLQSADRSELRLLGRIHTWEQFEESFALARGEGFCNINVDLMSALPGQTAASWENTLRSVLLLHPEHISAYSLIIEEGTPFYGRYAEGTRRGLLPDEDAERAMYARTGELLAAAGYEHYEISNYALPGFACRHNICYWERTDYIGFGLGAASLRQQERFSRLRGLKEYMAAAEEGRSTRTEIQKLSQKDEMEEFMFLGLRLLRGVSAARFYEQFGCRPEEVYGDVLDKYERLGLLAREGERIFLTERGIDVSNVIFSDFLLDEDAL